MIFSLGKARAGERPVEAQTLERWRAVAEEPGELFESVRVITPEKEPPEQKVITLSEETSAPEEKPFVLTRTNVSELKPAFTAFASKANGSAPQPETPAKPTTTPISVVPPRPASPRPFVTLDEDLKRRFGATLRSALGPGTVIEGKFSFDSPVRIDGSLTGDVKSSSALIVGDQSVVNAKIRVGTIIIAGKVTGEIEASELVEIRAGGCYTGPIQTKRLVIEDGGIFNGTCHQED